MEGKYLNQIIFQYRDYIVDQHELDIWKHVQSHFLVGCLSLRSSIYIWRHLEGELTDCNGTSH